MITLQLTDNERKTLIICIESAVKHAPNSLDAATSLLPLAQKIAQAKPDETPAE